jgi:hypothetical protein
MNLVCRRGMHALCDGKAWRADLGGIGQCRCFCHAPRIVQTVPVQRGASGTEAEIIKN